MDDNRANKLLPFLSLLLVSFLWGATFPAGKYVLASLSLYSFMSIRFIIAVIVLAPLSWGALKKATRRDCLVSCLIGLILFMMLSLQTMALLYTSAAKSSFVFSVYVVLVLVLSFVFYKTPLTLKIIAACLLTVTGLGFIAGEGGLKGGVDLGMVITLGAALFMAMQIVAIGRYAQKIAPMVITFFQILVVAVLCLGTGLALDGPPDFKAIEGPVWFWIVFMAVFSTAASYALQCSAQKKVDQAVAAIILSMCCLFGALQAWLFLGEPLPPKMIIGGMLLVLSVVIAQLPDKYLYPLGHKN